MSWHEERERLLHSRISELGLRIEGSALEPQVAQLYAELDANGLQLQAADLSQRRMGLPRGRAGDRRAVLSRQSAARADRAGDRGKPGDAGRDR